MGSSNEAGDNLLRAEREANPKKTGNKRNGKRRAAKGKKNNVKRKSSKSKRNGKTGPSKRKNSGKKRNSAKKPKGKKRNSSKKQTKIQDISQKPRKDTRQTDCLASAMGKAKKYIKYLNQQRKANRIKKAQNKWTVRRQ